MEGWLTQMKMYEGEAIGGVVDSDMKMYEGEAIGGVVDSEIKRYEEEAMYWRGG